MPAPSQKVRIKSATPLEIKTTPAFIKNGLLHSTYPWGCRVYVGDIVVDNVFNPVKNYPVLYELKDGEAFFIEPNPEKAYHEDFSKKGRPINYG